MENPDLPDFTIFDPDIGVPVSEVSLDDHNQDWITMVSFIVTIFFQ